MPSPPRAVWGDAERAWLRVAYGRADHTQERCAAELRDTYKVTEASQALVSRWVTGNIKRPGCVTELLAYCEQHAPDARPKSGPPPKKVVVGPSTPSADPVAALAKELRAELVTLRAQVIRERRRSGQVADGLTALAERIAVAVGQVDQASRSGAATSRSAK